MQLLGRAPIEITRKLVGLLFCVGCDSKVTIFIISTFGKLHKPIFRIIISDSLHSIQAFEENKIHYV